MDALSAMHRANQAFHLQVMETAALSCGVAHFSSRFQGFNNQVREVRIGPGGSFDAAWREVTNFFGRMGQECGEWVAALDEPVAPLEEFLRGKSFVPMRKAVMLLESWPDLPANAQMRVLPGRAMRQALRDLVLGDRERGAWVSRDAWAEIMLSRLDDPGFDVLLGMVDGKAVGHGGLLQVGPVGAIYDVFVRPEYRRRGVARAIMRELLATCRRLDLRTVVLEVGEGNPAARLYEACSFRPAGISVDFVLKR